MPQLLSLEQGDLHLSFEGPVVRHTAAEFIRELNKPELSDKRSPGGRRYAFLSDL